MLNLSFGSDCSAQTKTALNEEDFYEKQSKLAYASKKGAIGRNAKGVIVPKQLQEQEMAKQKAKIIELFEAGKLFSPLNYADLSELYLSDKLIKIPSVNENYFIEKIPFTINLDDTDEDFFTLSEAETQTLKEVAKKMNLSLNGSEENFQKEIYQRLHQLLEPAAKNILEDIAAAYSKKFKRPLKFANLITTKMASEILKRNSSEIQSKYKDYPLAPHVTGLAFDLQLNNLTAQEQNFLLSKVAELEMAGKVDANLEIKLGYFIHIFVYPDAQPPIDH